MAAAADYYRARERKERDLAQAAQGQEQVIHRLSAELYAELCRQSDSKPSR